MCLKIYKFGGASVKNADGINNVTNILDAHKSKAKILTVVSATGKTTNALEVVANSYYNADGKAKDHLQNIKNDHVTIMQGLDIFNEEVAVDINNSFVEIDGIISNKVQDGYNYIYDQIVSVGELVSSKILYHASKKKGLNIYWLDARDVLVTDNSYREAKVMWKETQARIDEKVKGLFDQYDIVVTQGFIGCSTENFNTTLGREGSDFTAGVFSYCLDADSMSIWKDVPGILTADPRLFENVAKIDRLDYREAIEMTYFGAKVIHPKTIKPLQNKNIPLYVKPFNDHEAEGTIITSDVDTAYPPVIVIDRGQSLIHISTKDFSFVAEEHLSEIFEKLNKYKLKVNMMRNTAISFSLAVTNDTKKIIKLIEDLSTNYNVLKDDDLELITVRHHDASTVQRMKEGKIVLFEETFRQTVRMAVKDIPQVTRK